MEAGEEEASGGVLTRAGGRKASGVSPERVGTEADWQEVTEKMQEQQGEIRRLRACLASERAERAREQREVQARKWVMRTCVWDREKKERPVRVEVGDRGGEGWQGRIG